jgi:hypothetical protein
MFNHERINLTDHTKQMEQINLKPLNSATFRPHQIELFKGVATSFGHIQRFRAITWF